MNTNTAIFIGQETLLLQCADIWLLAGNSIEFMISKNPQINAWCNNNGIPFSHDIDESLLDNINFDILFSLTNLQKLNDHILSLAKIASINFHDGPLPQYAGLNVPAWAILSGEDYHGITFHEMTSEIDGGRIIKQKTFPLSNDDTALTVNIKCYEAAIEGFSELTEDINNNHIQSQEQDSVMSNYFTLGKKPERNGIIDFNQTIAQISALVRAVDYGPYYCPLNCTKLNLGRHVQIIKSFKFESACHPIPGTVIAIDKDSITVACIDGAVRLADFYSIHGDSIAPLVLAKTFKLNVGEVITPLSATDINHINLTDQESGRHEAFWLSALRNHNPIEITLAKGSKSQGHIPRTIQAVVLPPVLLDFCKQFDFTIDDALVSFVLLWASRIGAKSAFDIAYAHTGITPEVIGRTGIHSYIVPLQVAISAQQSITEFIQYQQSELEYVRTKRTFSNDLLLREPQLHNIDKLAYKPLTILQSADECLDFCQSDLVVQININEINLSYDSERISKATAQRISEQLNTLIQFSCSDPSLLISQVSIATAVDQQHFLKHAKSQHNNMPQIGCVHELFEQQIMIQSESTALVFENQSLSYSELNQQANKLARTLQQQGLMAGDLVGILLDRSIDMVVSLFAVLKAGAAYLPLDPTYPSARLSYMINDSESKLLITQEKYADAIEDITASLFFIEAHTPSIKSQCSDNLHLSIPPTALAYTIYTSGSSGQPKGVEVEHHNVSHFCLAMDEKITLEKRVWLAVTSISFDISVLEIFWALARGFKVVIYADDRRQKQTATSAVESSLAHQHMDFSLFYWNVASEDQQYSSDKYRLLLEGAQYADQHHFKAVWTPERHFASFGGLYPNPSLTSAALSTITNNIELRAGSCVAPLHSPIRIAEEWSVVDNLSNGRVGIALAAGWAPPDFVIKPENFDDAKNVMLKSLQTIRQLWRGEHVDFEGPNGTVSVRTLPRPIQKELPIWITTAGNIDSYISAAKMGANVLTHLLGQSVEEVGEKVTAYRQAWREAGHTGEGKITLMLHTFVGKDMDEIEQQVRQPMINYLKSAMFLVKDAAWNFPTYKKMSAQQGQSLDDFFSNISEQDLEDLLEFAFQRYFHSSGLFGSPEDCIAIVDQIKAIGVDEIGCLIDFGIEDQLVLEHLPYLNQLREKSAKQENAVSAYEYNIPRLMQEHGVSHLQCTPTMATMLLADPDMAEPLKNLQQLMIGGEAFPSELAKNLRQLIPGRITNMYGPTETTVWSATHEIIAPQDSIPLGRPIAHTQIFIVDQYLQLLPYGVPGELLIAGDGVVRGYHNRQELNKNRFIEHPLAEGRVYRTGDLAQIDENGLLHYLGRMDAQIKVHGYRIELGEIETPILTFPGVLACAVILREDHSGDKRLVAYLHKAADAEINTTELKSVLAKKLPDFMLPSLFVCLDSLPLTPNGKIDRQSMPVPERQSPNRETHFAAPETELQTLIADIWKDMLQIDSVGIDENFFDLGGHSLLSVQVLKQLRDNQEIQKSLRMTDLFRYPTIAKLAHFISSKELEDTNLETSIDRANTRKSAMLRRRKRSSL